MDEMSGPGNLTHIRGGSKNKKAQEHVNIKLSRAEVQLTLVEAIRRQPRWNRDNPSFPVRYEVLQPTMGVRIPVYVTADEVVRVIPLESVKNDLLLYIENSLGHRRDLQLTDRTALETVRLWQASTVPIWADDLSMVRWKSEPGLTYRRLPWDQQHDQAPTWESMLRRMTNAQAFCDWIGSLLVEDSSLHGYVWLYGPGGDGKGSINRFLANVFGPSYRSKQPPSSARGSFDKFWTYGLLGARLVVFPDCDNASFTTTGLFKSLTGGDPVDVEAKGSMSFTTILGAKYFIISNEKPTISSEKSDLRRIIYCEMTSPPDTDAGFEQRLWDEGGVFLTYCLNNYLSKYADRRAIEPDPEAVEELVSENEQHFEDFFHEYFFLEPSSFCVAGQLGRAAKEAWGNSRKIYSNFLRWLERRYGILVEFETIIDQTRNAKKKARIYRGMGAHKRAVDTSDYFIDKETHNDAF